MKVVSIQIAPSAAEPMSKVRQVRAVAGRGLEGDRYFLHCGTFGGAQVTLIELEAIEALRRDYGVSLQPKDARRNIVTSDVPLNHLVGREFQVGSVPMRGIKLCEPCGHLAKLSGTQVIPGLVHRGGLKAEILADGILCVGDRVSI